MIEVRPPSKPKSRQRRREVEKLVSFIRGQLMAAKDYSFKAEALTTSFTLNELIFYEPLPNLEITIAVTNR